MFLNLLKTLFIFIVFTHTAGAKALIDKEVPSEKEEIKDTIVVHGMTLYGKIMNMGHEKLSFKLLYSEGVSYFAYRDIDSISTKYNYHISYNRIDIIGRVVAIEDQKYIKVVSDNNEHRTVKIADIDNFVMSVINDDSFENKVRNRFPYTKGDINVGFKLEDGSTIKRSIDVLLNLKHKQAEHEIALYLNYEYETRETATTPKYDYTDELVGILGYKNHFHTNLFWYGTLLADYDRPRFIKNRYVPSVGFGYRFDYSKSFWIEPVAGLGYVNTTYTEDMYEEKRFASGALGLRGKYRKDDVYIIDTFIVDGFVFYYPSLKTPNEDWILRSNINFTIPLFDFLSVKLAVNYINNANPDPSVGNNKTTTNLLFGLNF